MVMTTFFSVQSDTSAVRDLRACSQEQLIAAAKTGRRAPFGEPCERHVKRAFRVIHRIMRTREDAEDALQDCLLNSKSADVSRESCLASRMPLLQSVGRSVRASTN